MELKLDQEQMRVIVSGAILQQMGEDQRHKLVEDANKNLLTPSRDNYTGKSQSPIELMFFNAVQSTARAVVERQFKEDERVKATIEKLVADALIKATSEEKYPVLVEHLASLIATSFKPEYR